MPAKPEAVPPDAVPPAAAEQAAVTSAAVQPDAVQPAAVPDVKEQFRLALQRKRATSGDSHGGGPDGASKIHNASGRAANKREFRRKSGG